jgi:hypothetical protein
MDVAGGLPASGAVYWLFTFEGVGGV